jgi:hypothetical protein
MQPEFEFYLKEAENANDFVIEIRNGKPYAHPIGLSNFKCAYPEIDIDNLPKEYAIFRRTPRPNIIALDKVYPYLMVNETSTYRWFGNIVIEDWGIRPMTKKEIIEKQNNTKTQWYSDPFNSTRWTFDEKTCSFVPPIPYPKDYYEKLYRWEDETHSWQLTPFDPIKHYEYVKKNDKEKAKEIRKILKKAKLI